MTEAVEKLTYPKDLPFEKIGNLKNVRWASARKLVLNVMDRGGEQRVKKAIKAGAPLNFYIENGFRNYKEKTVNQYEYTPLLHHMLECKLSEETILLALKHGADPSAPKINTESGILHYPIHKALANGYHEAALQMLKHIRHNPEALRDVLYGVDRERKRGISDGAHEPLIYIAAKYDSLGVLKFVHAHYPEAFHVTMKSGGHVAEAILLGLDVDVVMYDAADIRADAAVSYLLEHEPELSKSEARNQMSTLAAKHGMTRTFLELAKRPGAVFDRQKNNVDNVQNEIMRQHMVKDASEQLMNRLLLPAMLMEAGYGNPGFQALTEMVVDDNIGTRDMSILADNILRGGNVDEIREAARVLYNENATIKEKLPAIQQLMRPYALALADHHELNVFPDDLLPIKPSDDWAAILPEDYVDAQTDCRVTCLTSQFELMAESSGEKEAAELYKTEVPHNPQAGLGHCVGTHNYDNKCRGADHHRSHILAIRDKNGKRLSTVEAKLVPKENIGNYSGYHFFPIEDSANRLVIIQHYGKGNGPPPLAADETFKHFTKALETKKGMLQETDLGRLSNVQDGEKNAAKKAIQPVLEQIGYEPSWEHINKCFTEFKDNKRRACMYVDDDNNMVHQDDYLRSKNMRTRFKNDLIDGYAIVKLPRHYPGKGTPPAYAMDHCWALHGKDAQALANKMNAEEKRKEKPEFTYEVRSLRHLDARSYLKATGILEELHHMISHWIKFNQHKEQVTALEQYWQALDHTPIIEPIPGNQVAHAEHQNAQEHGNENEVVGIA